MSQNDQADGFFDKGHIPPNCSHPECQPFEDCHLALHKTEDSGKGRPVNIPENDVWSLTHGRIPFRLAKGFRMMYSSER